jgi:hypothetical protein
MNIIVIHNKIKIYHDQVGTDRFPTWQIDNAIDMATRSIVKNRYDKETVQGLDDKFLGKNQQNRDEIGSLIEKLEITTGDFSDNLIPSTVMPDDFWILIDMMIKLTSIEDELYPVPLNYNMKKSLYSDPYLRPSTSYPYKIFYYRSNEGREIIHGSTESLANGEIHYLKKPAKPSYGIEVTDDNFSDHKLNFWGETVIASGVTKIKLSGGTYASYNIGDEFTFNSGDSIEEGSIVYDYTNLDVPDLLHDEICSTAAGLLSGSISNYDKGNYIKQEKLED